MIEFDHNYFMEQAFREARLAFEQDEVPIGAVVVIKNKIIGRGFNQTERLKDATAHARKFFKEIPPSSPSVAMFKEGRLVFFLPRNEIEGYTHEQIARKIIPAFNEHCDKAGPSVSMEKLQEAFSKE